MLEADASDTEEDMLAWVELDVEGAIEGTTAAAEMEGLEDVGKSFAEWSVGVTAGLGRDAEATAGAAATMVLGRIGARTGPGPGEAGAGMVTLDFSIAWSTVNWIAACAGRVRR
jgi:hypothetical protein